MLPYILGIYTSIYSGKCCAIPSDQGTAQQLSGTLVSISMSHEPLQTKRAHEQTGLGTHLV